MKTNEFFWNNGYLVVRNFISEAEKLSFLPDDLYAEKHIEWLYDGIFEGEYENEYQVKGSYSRTCFPPLKKFHQEMKYQIQKIILESDIKFELSIENIQTHTNKCSTKTTMKKKMI